MPLIVMFNPSMNHLREGVIALKKSIVGMAAASVLLTLSLVACGGGQQAAPAETAEPEATAEATEKGEPLETQAIMDAVFDASSASVAEAENIHMGLEKDGKVEVTFTTSAGEYAYVVDAYTGEVLEKTEPDAAAASAPAETKSSDPTEAAINACFDSLEGYNGGAENIKVKVVEANGSQQVEVQFDWDGQHHEMVYDVASGQVVQ